MLKMRRLTLPGVGWTLAVLLLGCTGGSDGVDGSTASVLVAADSIPVATSGESALERGLVAVEARQESEVPDLVLTDPDQLAERLAGFDIPAGVLLTEGMFRLRYPLDYVYFTVEPIPEGMGIIEAWDEQMIVQDFVPQGTVSETFVLEEGELDTSAAQDIPPGVLLTEAMLE